MLYIMRHKIKSFVMWLIIAAFLGTIFFAWGVGSNRLGKSDKNWIARIGEEVITPAEYDNELQRMEAQLRDFPPELLKQLNLKEQAMNNLIQQRLLLAKAEEMKIEVSDQEVAAAIQGTPYFQENGIFSNRAYKTVLSQSRMSPAGFEEKQREDLRIQKIQSLIQDAAKITEAEIRQSFLEKNETITADYVLLNFVDHRPSDDPSDDALQDYYKSSKEAFRTQEEINVRYSFITPQDFFDDIKISDEDVEETYRDSQSLYVQPEQIKARHILIRLAEDADEETANAAREKTEKILEQAKQGEDFADLATRNSDDSTASKGGDLGFFKQGQMVAPFEEAAFALNPGEISPVVRTQFGYHIIKVEEKQEEQTQSLEQVRDQILRELKTEKGMIYVKKNSMRLYSEIRKGKAFESAVEEKGLTAKETGYFTRKDGAPGGVPIDMVPAFIAEAFAADEGGVGGVIKGESGYILLKTLERKAPRIPELEEVRAEVVESVLELKAREETEKKAEELVQAVQKKGSFDKALTLTGAGPAETTTPFTRNEFLISPDFTKTSFALTEESPSAYLEDPKGYYVVFLKEKSPPKEETLDEQKEDLVKELLQENRNNLFSAWLESVRKKASVDINPEFADRI